jgi:hypothetical protein
MEKRLGKITGVTFGKGGYDDCMFGFGVTLTGDAWGVCDFIGWWWDGPSEHAKWSKSDQENRYLEAVNKLKDTLFKAKKSSVQDLKGVPVEAIFDQGKLQSWRVLTEVL